MEHVRAMDAKWIYQLGGWGVFTSKYTIGKKTWAAQGRGWRASIFFCKRLHVQSFLEMVSKFYSRRGYSWWRLCLPPWPSPASGEEPGLELTWLKSWNMKVFLMASLPSTMAQPCVRRGTRSEVLSASLSFVSGWGGKSRRIYIWFIFLSSPTKSER